MNREPVPIDEIDGYVTKDSMYRLISQYKREGRISQATAQDMCNAIAYSIGVERTKDRWIWDGNKEECICSECGKEKDIEIYDDKLTIELKREVEKEGDTNELLCAGQNGRI